MPSLLQSYANIYRKDTENQIKYLKSNWKRKKCAVIHLLWMRSQLTTTWIKSMVVQCSLKSKHDFDWSHITNPSAFILTVYFECTSYARCLWHAPNAIFSIWSSFCLATRNHWTKRKYYLSITHTNTQMRL